MLGACNKIAIFLFAIALVVNSYKLEEVKAAKISVPRWISLCDKGHKYLFSHDGLDWVSAGEMCELLGGYLVRIENRHENNCLLAYAQYAGQLYYWTSGNDVEIEGVYVMEDGTEMDWISNLFEMDG